MNETLGLWLASRAMAKWWEPERKSAARPGQAAEARPGVARGRGWLALARITARLGGALRGGRPRVVAAGGSQCCGCE